MTVDLTVLSVFHNRPDGGDASLGSLEAQTYGGFRAVVVDDGSTDGTLASLERHRSDRITVVAQRNAGFTPTMVRLCAEADTEFVALHGAGDESLPERLAKQVAFLRANPSVVAVACGIENVDEVSGHRWDVLPPQTIKRGPLDGGFGISHGEIMFRREAYLAAGGYRTLFPLGQASDLFRRLSRFGDFGYVPEVLYRRYLRLDGVNANPAKIAQRGVLAALSVLASTRPNLGRGEAKPQARYKDDLDRYGVLYPYFAPADRGIAISLAIAAARIWSTGDRDLALRLARRSVAERPTLRGRATLAAIRAGVGPGRGFARRVLYRMDRSEQEMTLDRLAKGHAAHGASDA